MGVAKFIFCFQEVAKTFISKEQLDRAVEECLDNLTIYDFGIDQQGNIYEGRTLEALEKPTTVAPIYRPLQQLQPSETPKPS